MESMSVQGYVLIISIRPIHRWTTLHQHKQVLEFLESVASKYLIDSMRKSASKYVDNPSFNKNVPFDMNVAGTL